MGAACDADAMQVMTILYPKTDDSTFDMDYYTSTHMPMIAEALGDACQGWGAAAIQGDDYMAMGWVMITSAEALNASMAEHGGKIVSDVANYTNVQPTTLLGEHVGGSA